MKRENRRRLRHFFISGDLYLRLVSYGLVYMALAFLVLFSFGLYPVFRDMFASGSEAVQYQAAIAFLALLRHLVPVSILLLLIFVAHMLVICHRIAGPLNHFRQAFQALGRGQFSSRVRLRRNDYLKTEAQDLNRMIEELERRFDPPNDAGRQMAEKLAHLARTCEDPRTRQDLEALLGSLRHPCAAGLKNGSEAS